MLSAFSIGIGGVLPAPSSRHLLAEQVDSDSSPAYPLWTSSNSLCADGKAAPQLYLLGAQKSGTTALGATIFAAGGISASYARGVTHGSAKEICALHDAFGYMNDLRDREEKDNKHVTNDERTKWSSRFVHDCTSTEASNSTFTDMTSDYYSEPALPALLAELHGPAAARLTLALIVREPLARMQSSFYWSYTDGSTFGDHAIKLWETLQDRQALDPSAVWSFTRTTIASAAANHGTSVEFLVGSLYGQVMREWLTAFAPQQFIILPSKWALDNPAEAITTISSGRAAMRLDASSANFGVRDTPVSINARAHPTLADDLDANATAWLRDTFFDPDTEALVSLLAAAGSDGLVVAGCGEGLCDDAAGLKAHITAEWVMDD